MFNLRTEKSKQRHHKELNYYSSLFEKRLFSKLQPILGRQFLDAARLLELHIINVNSPVEEQIQRMQKVFCTFFAQTSDFFLNMMYTVLVELDVQKITNEKNFKDEFKNNVKQWFMNYKNFNVEKMNTVTKRQIQNFINKKLSEGSSFEQIATQLRSKKVQLNQTRLHTTTKTITHSVMNYTLDAIVQFLQLNFDAEWISSKKEQKRKNFDHRNANGERVVHGEKFMKTGEALSFPGDPNGNIANIANCSCVLCYHLTPKTLSNRRRQN